MANPRLLAEKLIFIRLHLNLSQTAMRERLDVWDAARVSQYENGNFVPSLTVTLAYARLGKIPMESLVDDEVGVYAFRKQLGTFECT